MHVNIDQPFWIVRIKFGRRLLHMRQDQISFTTLSTSSALKLFDDWFYTKPEMINNVNLLPTQYIE